MMPLLLLNSMPLDGLCPRVSQIWATLMIMAC